MDMLKHFWRNEHVDLYPKYCFFLARPINVLLWGCESWAINETSFDGMDIFLHYSTRQILGVKWSQMMDKHISNKQIRNKFYNIKDIRKMIPSRQLQFVGKVMRREDEFLPKQLMIGWVNNKRPIGRPTTTIKTSICQEPETTLSSKYYFILIS